MPPRVRFYAPLSDGAFQDVIDDLGHAGIVCSAGASPNFQRCSTRGARYVIVSDPDQIRVQLLDEGGLGARAWDPIDGILSRAVRTSGEFVGGVTFFDPDLTKYGNAMSPFSVQPSYEVAQRMMSLPLADRYGDRAYQNWWEPSEFEYVGVAGVFDRVSTASAAVDKRALVATAAIAGISTLLALRTKKHRLEIAGAGLVGIALAWHSSSMR